MVDIEFATVHPGEVSDDDRAELTLLRVSFRDHWATLSGLGRDPLEGSTWSPDTDRFDALLQALAAQSGWDSPNLPWTNLRRLRVDDLCRSAGVLDGLPLLPD